MRYPMMYPDIYYQIQPFVTKASDYMDVNSDGMPDTAMMNKMVDWVYDGVTRAYPDMMTYAHEANDIQSSAQPLGRRGFLRDFIAILLLSELFRRRRWGY